MSDTYKKQIGGNHYASMKIQPSEFAKFTTALALSKYLSEKNKTLQLRKKLKLK